MEIKDQELAILAWFVINRDNLAEWQRTGWLEQRRKTSRRNRFSSKPLLPKK